MRETESRARCDQAALFQNFEVRIPGDFSQREHSFGMQNLQLPFEITATIRNLLGERFVVRRRAANSGRNVSIVELQAVVAVEGSWLVREAGLEKRLIEKISRAVTGEDSAGAVGAVRRRGQPENQQHGFRIAETRYGLAPVCPLAIRAPFFARYFFAIGHQPRTFAAHDNFFLQHAQRCERLGHRVRKAGGPSCVAVRGRELLPERVNRRSRAPSSLWPRAAPLPLRRASPRSQR